MTKNNNISFFGLISAFCFVIFSFVGRILYPFGDEPDFTIRAPRVINGDHPFWSPYSIFHNFIENLNVDASICKIVSTRTSILSLIDTSCIENIEQILIRLFLTIMVVLPLLYAIIFRKSFIYNMHLLRCRLPEKEWNHRLDVLSLTIIFPSVLYYLGILAEEQFTLLLSLFIFLFWEFWLLIIFILILIMSIDIGNSIVVLLFVIFGYFFPKVEKYFNMKFCIYLMVGTIIFAYFINSQILLYLEDLPLIGRKAEAMYTKALLFEDKYYTILRPIITFMSVVFMTPSGLKVIVIYIIYGLLFILLIIKLFIYKNENKSEKFNKIYILFYSVFTTIFFMVFLFPDYSFAKYYIFMLPFVFSMTLLLFNFVNLMFLFFFSNVVIFIYLILYHIYS